MGQGYVRNDVSNNIADENVVNASDLDGEFDALVAAFAASTGHTHDGTTAEGGPVSVLGPAQDWVATSSALYPKTDNTYDIGQVGNELRDLRVDRFAYIDGLVCEETATFVGATIADLGTVTTANIDGGTIDNTVIGGTTPVNGFFATIGAGFARVTTASESSFDLQATAGTDTHERTRLRRTTSEFAILTGNSSASSFVTDLLATVGASGISNWKFNTNGSLALEIDNSTGITFSADATFNTMVFNNPASVVTALGFTESASDISGGIIPAGGIIMWSGSVASIPSGWALCDGSNGTPDLRGRFVVGAGGAYTPGNTGGADSVTLSTTQIPSHTHGFSGTTSSAGNHNHTGAAQVQSLTGSLASRRKDGTTSILSNSSGILTVTEFGSGASQTRVGDGGGASTSDLLSIDATHGHNLAIDNGGVHSHTFSGTSDATGSGGSHENRPPYYALAYIMKL